jgi:hypothetical protein
MDSPLTSRNGFPDKPRASIASCRAAARGTRYRARAIVAASAIAAANAVVAPAAIVAARLTWA